MRRGVERAFDIAESRKLAKRRLPAPMFHDIDGAADDEWTLRRNSTAFDAYEFRPRCLVDVAQIDLSTSVFGERIEWPFFCPPTALSRPFNYQGEHAVVRAASAVLLSNHGGAARFSDLDEGMLAQVGESWPG